MPAIGDFKVMDVKVVREDEQYALVHISDPISIGQSLDELIVMSEQEALSYTILGSEEKAYAANKLDRNLTVTVNEGIANEWD